MFENRHVVITGGSEGLGLALAKQLVARRARVTLIARTQSKLQSAEAEVLQCCPSSSSAAADPQPPVFCYSADVTKYNQVVDAVRAAEAALGPVDVLICCAGAAEVGYFHETPPEVFERQMQVNYLGALHAAKAVIDGLLARNSGHICFIGSGLSLLGMIGYSAYCPSKFALRGLAECLRNELQGSAVRVSISYPPDINTPGYARESLAKPWETAKLSEGGGLQSPDKVAAGVLAGLAGGDFLLPNTSRLLGLLQALTAGVVPRCMLQLVWQGLLGLAGPLICHVAAAEHDGVARRGAAKRFARLWSAGQAAGPGAPPPID